VRVSVVIRSKDEAPRLRLTLASLAVQTEPAEVVVVNDGSTDHTDAVVAEAARDMAIVSIRNAEPLGRSGAANAGAERATGDILLFLDGDTVAAPDLVERHLAAHRSESGLVVRGDTRHLRCTRFFADPETGAPRPGEEARVERMSAAELDRMRVTRAQVLSDFQSIDARSQPGIYPGAGPRLIYELEMEALRQHPGCSVLWAAAAGANQSVSAEGFRRVGGFDRDLTINEHRELALRLCRSGFRMAATDGGRSYHLTHRVGWRDPLEDGDWERLFYARHPIPEVALLRVLWGSLADPCPLPPPARIVSLPDLARAAEACAGTVGANAVREAHFAATAGIVHS
jgi:glycosyltransferase involved in cell wall biosynthesis